MLRIKSATDRSPATTSFSRHGFTFSNILTTIGHTPLVELQRVIPQDHAKVLLKCEFFNPLSSVKDRIGKAMIESAERTGELIPGGHIVEPTSGNTGIALAFCAAAKGYQVTLVMPDSMSYERRALLLGLGARFVLTPAQGGMRAAIGKAEQLLNEVPDAWMPRQFDNPANPDIHESTTGPEIWEDTMGNVDILVAGVGTGGTITGVTRFLREHNPNLQTIAVEPAESPVISGGVAGAHGIQGIGAGFIPRNLDTALIDEVETVTTDEAFHWARLLAVKEGVLAGISTGANVAAASRIASRPANRGKTIVTFACSSGERYLSTSLYQLVGMAKPAVRHAEI